MPAAAVPIRINVDYNIPGLFATERDRREVLRAAWADCGTEWHKKYLPRHFRRGAEARYGYRRRTAAYLKRKVREARRGRAVEGGVIPLVFTGLLRRTLTSSATIRGYPSRFSVQMTSLTYAPQRRRTTKQPPLIEEAFRLRDDEANQLADFLAARITHHNGRVRHRRRVRLG
jgi:hypothetical protein